MGLRGPQPGTNYKPEVAHSERDCHIHGRTTHRESITGGSGSSKVWKCMACGREQVKARAIDRKAGIPASRAVSKPTIVIVGKTCDIHHLVLPATGECDYC